MKNLMLLAAVAAVSLLMTTGCGTCSHCSKKDASCGKPAAACTGACCSSHEDCAKCCKDADGCAKCCHKS
jgi:hypothetical protein